MTCSSIRLAVAVLLLAGVAVAAAPVGAMSAPLVVKMATLAPEGSSWFRVLQEMGEEWSKASDGAVTLRIYPGGVAGDEDAVIRKMRVARSRRPPSPASGWRTSSPPSTRCTSP